MSHFSVLVITPNGTEEEVAALLQPYHEYECTGIMDEYVMWIDHTEEVTKEYRESDEYQKDYATVEEFAKEYHGYKAKDGQIGRMTNPKKKWDWWVVGGRYGNRLKEDVDYLTMIIDKKEPEVGNCMKIKDVDDTGLSCFALVDAQGAWHENGEMGWFALVSNEKNKFDWKAEMFKILAEANQEHFITMVDCHI